MPDQWTRLSREESYSVVDTLGSRQDALVFSKEATEVVTQELPFYQKYKLYRLTNYATMPSFTAWYLGDGLDFHTLDGTATPIYKVNEKDTFTLTEQTVVPYLDFFFEQVQGKEGDIFLVKNPHDLPFMMSLSQEQQDMVVNQHKPLEVSPRTASSDCTVKTTLYYDGSLISALVRVSPEGKISFHDQGLLLKGLYIPASALASGRRA